MGNTCSIVPKNCISPENKEGDDKHGSEAFYRRQWK
jgi:hypothetical protein